MSDAMFSTETSLYYMNKNKMYNEAFLESKKVFFKNLLKVRKVISLRDIKIDLGFKISADDLLCGWVDEHCDSDELFNYIYDETIDGYRITFTARFFDFNEVEEVLKCS